jgi:hypothetical protein
MATTHSTDGLTSRGRYWREQVREWRRSGLTQAAYCQQHGLNAGTFCWWKRQLARRERMAPAVRLGPPARGKAAADLLRTTFAPVRIRAEEDHENSSRIEIVLPDQRCIRLCGRIDRQQLADVLAVLEAVTC